MTEPRGNGGTELVIWAAAEARRLRRQETGLQPIASVPTAAAPPGPEQGGELTAHRHRAHGDGLVVEWQLPMASAGDTTA